MKWLKNRARFYLSCNYSCKLESIGLNDYTEDDKLMKHFNDELKSKSTQYCVKLSLREHPEILTDNFQN